MLTKAHTNRLPLILENKLVVLPSTVASISVTSELLLKALKKEKKVAVTSSKKEHNNSFVVLCEVLDVFELASGGFKVLISGKCLGTLVNQTVEDQISYAEVAVVDFQASPRSAVKEILNKIKNLTHRLIEKELIGEELMLILNQYYQKPLDSCFQFLAQLSQYIRFDYSVLAESEFAVLKNILGLLKNISKNNALQIELNRKTSDLISQRDRERFLKEQLNLIVEELGYYNSSGEVFNLKEKLEKLEIPSPLRDELEKQIDRLQKLSLDAAEYSVLKAYLDFVLELPWGKFTQDVFDIAKAKRILEKSHYGKEKVKTRILDFLSVCNLTKSPPGQILCFVGPPGVGKTSFATSIAEALGRKFARVSLGGIRDEAEIRGHRKAYIGSTAGRIILALKSAQSCNPVIVLDELDKVGVDFRGDPSAALLEALDPEQNKEFVDHYLGFPFDLSKVIFVCTANNLDTIPLPLLDRLEIVEMDGYSRSEKVKIFTGHLLPQQMEKNGITHIKLSITTEAIKYLIDRYTRESGLRGLIRETANLCRKIATRYLDTKQTRFRVDILKLRSLLGPEKFSLDPFIQAPTVGVALGLAWTASGGDLLPIEVGFHEGKGNLILTGQLGQVMQESARVAFFYIKAHAKEFNIDLKKLNCIDIHVNAIYGGIPKDGPSAGIVLLSAMLSAIQGRKVKNSVAATGEISLTGKVLEVGGVREKILAAQRYGIRAVILPSANEKDVQELPTKEREEMKFIFIDTISQALDAILAE